VASCSFWRIFSPHPPVHLLGWLSPPGEHIPHAGIRWPCCSGWKAAGPHLLAPVPMNLIGPAHLADRKAGTATAVAVELGEHRPPVEPHLVVEGAG